MLLSRFLPCPAKMTAPLSSCATWLLPPHPFVSPDKKDILRDAFTRSVELPAVRVPKTQLQKVSTALRPLALGLANFKFETDTDPDKKIILLDPDKMAQHAALLSPKAKDVLRESGVVMPATDTRSLSLTYEHYRLEQVLRVILPDDVKVAAFSQIGHIAHLNLKAEALPFKFLIGQAILDKLKVVKTVVNKTDQIDNTYRNFQMELLAGEEKFVTVQAANGCSFHLDFSKVYWNSRLCTEHSRVLDQLQPGDVLYDAFAGVGPFAVPAGRKGCRVLANDLNPESFRWLQHNVGANRSRRSALAVSCFNMDAKEFIEGAVAADYRWEALTSSGGHRRFLVMNLPALAVTFLGALKHLVSLEFVHKSCNSRWESLPALQVRCYCFLRGEEAAAKSGDQADLTRSSVEGVVARTMGLRALAPGSLGVTFVRNVAVAKDMYRLDFELTGTLLRAMHGGLRAGSEPEAKKARTGDE